MSTLRPSLSRLLVLGIVLMTSGCGGSSDAPPAGDAMSAEGDGEATAGVPSSLAAALYPDPPDETWETVPLDDERYVRATVEIACVSATTSGDPEAMRTTQRRVFYHHRTSAELLTAFGATVNADPERAISLGRRVSDGIARCPTDAP